MNEPSGGKGMDAPNRAWVGGAVAIGRRIRFVLAAAVLIGYWDSLLHLLEEALHLLIEVLEISFEHLVEAAFELSPREAQVVTAWTGLALAVCLAVVLVRKARTAARRALAEASARWKEFRTFAASCWIGYWPQLIMAAAAIVGYLVL
jgi:hypothetical protein